jgi:hypothetical protein
MLASMTSLRDCEIEGADVNEHTRQRLLNAIILREATCYAAFYFLVCCSQLVAAQLMLGFRDVPFASYFRVSDWRKKHTRAHRVSYEAANGIGRMPKTGA